MSSRALLLVCFALVLMAALLVAWYNFEAEQAVITGHRKFDVDRVEQLIDESRLSGREAAYYLDQQEIESGR
ncbi:MAG: hypothetical protein P9M14_12455 [Candidatus Alcyoniella australis]|nr:hypothetical protein [Candidatus Alcyoniella australis]